MDDASDASLPSLTPHILFRRPMFSFDAPLIDGASGSYVGRELYAASRVSEDDPSMTVPLTSVSAARRKADRVSPPADDYHAPPWSIATTGF